MGESLCTSNRRKVSNLPLGYIHVRSQASERRKVARVGAETRGAPVDVCRGVIVLVHSGAALSADGWCQGRLREVLAQTLLELSMNLRAVGHQRMSEHITRNTTHLIAQGPRDLEGRSDEVELYHDIPVPSCRSTSNEKPQRG